MRKRAVSVIQATGGAVVALIALSGLTSVQADPVTADLGLTNPPSADSTTLSQVVPTTETWDDHVRDVLRRLYERLHGNPADIADMTLKDAVATVNLRFTLFGIPPGSTPDEITQIEAVSLELANCADWDPGPPAGTSYTLIVFMHDLGKAVYTASELF